MPYISVLSLPQSGHQCQSCSERSKLLFKDEKKLVENNLSFSEATLNITFQAKHNTIASLCCFTSSIHQPTLSVG